MKRQAEPRALDLDRRDGHPDGVAPHHRSQLLAAGHGADVTGGDGERRDRAACGPVPFRGVRALSIR